jgi:uncharacterized membrane protein (Fun14 family)
MEGYNTTCHVGVAKFGTEDRSLKTCRGAKKIMSSEALLSSVIPFAGSGLLGYAMGFALKKILKWMLIIVGFLAGMFFVGVQLLERYGYVSTVNWDKLGNDTSTQIQHWATNADITILPNIISCNNKGV